MIRRTTAGITLLLTLIATSAFSTDGGERSSRRQSCLTLSTNLLSPFSGIQLAASPNEQLAGIVYSVAMGISSNFEYGLSINVGYFVTSKDYLQTRVSTGSADPTWWISQVHLGYQRYLGETDFYLGTMAKCWDRCNRLTGVHYFDLVPYLTAGWTPGLGRSLFLDLRLSQTVATYSFSSLDGSKGKAGWLFSHVPTLMPYHPCVSLDLGYRFPVH